MAGTAQGQQAIPVEAARATTGATFPGSSDLLAAALDCRLDDAQLPELLPRLRRERPRDFVQVERQYSAPDMDLYRLSDPASAWGSEGLAIVISANRVMLAVPGQDAEVAGRVDAFLGESPLPGVLDDRHALVVYPAQRPGLEGMTLVGCEYRIDNLSLLDDPADAWRKQPAPGTYARSEPLR
ncbi:MAG: hypothetical protein QM761_08015 [Pseudoxanthomonas sp.]